MKGPRLGAMAWRNLWRRRRRTLITISSIAFGSFLAVLFTALQDRNFADMIDLAARMTGGHVTLQNPEYQDKPTLSRSVQETDDHDRQDPEQDDVDALLLGLDPTVGDYLIVLLIVFQKRFLSENSMVNELQSKYFPGFFLFTWTKQ